MPKAIDLTGQVFGRLTAIERADVPTGKGRVWRCICICGKETFVSAKQLRFRGLQSCGCFRTERVRESLRRQCPYSALRLEELYKNGLSVQDIANLAGTTIGIVNRWFTTYQIEKRSISEAKRVHNVRFPDHFRKVSAAGLTVRLGMWEAGLLNVDHLHTPLAHKKKEKSCRKTIAARRAKQQAEREQSEAIERSLNGDTFR